MNTKTNTTEKTEPKKFTKSYIADLKASALPEKDQKIQDAKLPGFHIRRYRNGRMVYAVQFERSGPGATRTLGLVEKWDEDPDVARIYARKLMTEYNSNNGKVAEVKRPDVAELPPLTTEEFFGLRERFAPDGVEVVGIYRDKHRHGKKRASGNLEFIFDRFVLSVGRSTPFASLTQADVERWLATERKRINPRTNRPTKDVSMVRYMKTIRTAFRWATKKKINDVALIATNPARDIVIERTERKVDKSADQRFLNWEEETRLYAALAARDKRLLASPKYFGPTRRRDGCVYVDQLTPFVTIGLKTGARRGSLFNLRWSDLETRPFSRVRFDGAHTKSGQTYRVPMTKELRKVMDAWRPATALDSDLIFPGVKGQVQESTPDSWYALRKTIGLQWFRYHDTRHTFPSKLVQRGVKLKQVSAWLGHASVRMTERYAHLDPDQGSELIELLEQPLPAPKRKDTAA